MDAHLLGAIASRARHPEHSTTPSLSAELVGARCRCTSSNTCAEATRSGDGRLSAASMVLELSRPIQCDSVLDLDSAIPRSVYPRTPRFGVGAPQGCPAPPVHGGGTPRLPGSYLHRPPGRQIMAADSQQCDLSHTESSCPSMPGRTASATTWSSVIVSAGLRLATSSTAAVRNSKTSTAAPARLVGRRGRTGRGPRAYLPRGSY